MMTAEERIWKQSDTVVSSPLEDRLALLDTSCNVYYTLDGIGPFLWDCIAEGRSLAQLAAAAQERYQVSAQVAAEDIAGWLTEMSGAGLIVADT